MKPFKEYDWSACRFPVTYAEAIFNFCREHNFKKGLEVGFDSGTSALAFLRACPEASLVSMDIAETLAEGARMIQQEIPDWQERHVLLRSTDSRSFLPRMLENYDRFDYVYIDGDHLYDVVKQDLDNGYLLMAEDGYMLVDDCDPNHSHFGVWKAVKEFLAEHPSLTMRELPGTMSSHVIIH